MAANVFVGDKGGVTALDPPAIHKFLSTTGDQSQLVSGNAIWTNPLDLAADRTSGDVIVLDLGGAAATHPPRLLRFDGNSGARTEVAVGQALWNNPLAVSVDRDGDIIVLDGGGGAVIVEPALLRFDGQTGQRFEIASGHDLWHNAVDLVKHEHRGASSEEMYEEANQLTRWHYQWIVLHEILPLFIGQAAVDNILNSGRKFYRPEKPQIPVEFQGAAYRMGHTLVRPSYRANLAGDNDGSPFFGMIFDPSGEGQADPQDLRGGARARRRYGPADVLRFRPAFTDPGSTNPAFGNKLIDAEFTPLLETAVGRSRAAGRHPFSSARNIRGIT
jgi:hypothetical protein